MFDRVAGDAGLDLAPGALGERWREAARREREHPFDGPVPPFRSFRARWRERGEAMLEEYGVHGGGELVARHYAGLHASALPYREAAVAVERLASRHRLGVLSDADTDFLRLSLDRAGFAFAAVACSEQLQNYKPHIETFRAVCQRLDTRPDETVFVSDQPRNDIAGARNAGMRTVWINRNRLAWPDHPHDPAARNCQPPDVEIASLVDLQAVLS
jgi:2-haloalkanoic acid dehalogenase type II